MKNLYISKTQKKNIAYLRFKEKKIKCYVGLNGIGNKKREGDQVTPKGVFKVLEVFYRPDKVKYLKANFPKIKISKTSFWCTDSRSKNYNSYQTKSCKFCSEFLYREDKLYDIFLTLSYNIKPAKKTKGSAIFIHCSDD